MARKLEEHDENCTVYNHALGAASLPIQYVGLLVPWRKGMIVSPHLYVINNGGIWKSAHPIWGESCPISTDSPTGTSNFIGADNHKWLYVRPAIASDVRHVCMPDDPLFDPMGLINALGHSLYLANGKKILMISAGQSEASLLAFNKIIADDFRDACISITRYALNKGIDEVFIGFTNYAIQHAQHYPRLIASAEEAFLYFSDNPKVKIGTNLYHEMGVLPINTDPRSIALYDGIHMTDAAYDRAGELWASRILEKKSKIEYDEDNIEYLAIHAPRGWEQAKPDTINSRGLLEIVDAIGTKGTATRRLAIAYTFNYFSCPIKDVKKSIQNMLHLAEAHEIPIYIHLDGMMYWRNTGLWNWWDAIKGNDPALLNTDPGIKYDLANQYNVERYGWEMDKAVKIAWRHWGSQHRVEYKNGLAVPAPNLASPAFRAQNAAALSDTLSVIVQWYNNLAANKKYLIAGVVLGMELTVELNSLYLKNGNDFVYFDPKDDIANGLDLRSGTALRLGYAAAQTLYEQGHTNLPKPGTRNLSPEKIGYMIDYVLKNYVDFLIDTSLKTGIPAKKLITHIFPPPYDPISYKTYKFSGTWYKSFLHMDRVIPANPDVVPGWTVPIVNFECIDTTILKNREWAAIETHFWSIMNIPSTYAGLRKEYARDILPQRITELFNHGNCRHVNIKNWVIPLTWSADFRNAVRTALNAPQTQPQPTRTG